MCVCVSDGEGHMEDSVIIREGAEGRSIEAGSKGL